MVCEMDEETKEAFIDVMRSTVTIKSIVDALNAEGIKISRFQLGEARRECIKSSKNCDTFRGE
jgi:pyridoxine 5'-phosphate synthase PdxJ